MTKKNKALFPLFILLIVIFLTANNTVVQLRSYLLNNNIENTLGLSSGKKGQYDEFDLLNNFISHSLSITDTNPRTYLLAGNTHMRWVNNKMADSREEVKKTLTAAEYYYTQGLTLQPGNPFLWVNLANTVQRHNKTIFEHALKQAQRYGKTQPVIKQTIDRLKLAKVR